MGEMMEFSHRDEFRRWLETHCMSDDGIWLLFGKAGGPKTIKAGEALEEALCFGWIDGQMQSIDDKTYKKYFSMRSIGSKPRGTGAYDRFWQTKNRGSPEKRPLVCAKAHGCNGGADCAGGCGPGGA